MLLVQSIALTVHSTTRHIQLFLYTDSTNLVHFVSLWRNIQKRHAIQHHVTAELFFATHAIPLTLQQVTLTAIYDALN